MDLYSLAITVVDNAVQLLEQCAIDQFSHLIEIEARGSITNPD